MLRRLQAFCALGMWVVATPAAAQEATDEPAAKPAAKEPQASSSAEPSDKSTAKEQHAGAPKDAATGDATLKLDGEQASQPGPRQSVKASVEPVVPPAASEEKAEDHKGGWKTFITGYFRAPMTLGVSSRPGPETKVVGSADQFTGSPKTQISYGPTRTVDANYYSFAYTRLQEQDWAEAFIHAKKEHVEAVVGWMGYWFNSAGFRNPDSAWLPGMAYLTLDTDITLGDIKPNIALTAGAWWPGFGYHPKYDTYTLGRFRQMGEQVKLTVPINSDFTLTVTQGFGTGRDGSFNYGVSPPYQGKVYLDLMHYEHIQLSYQKYVDVGLHYNYEWTADPHQSDTTAPGKSYAEIADAYVRTIGGEVHVRVPYAGHLWLSPSVISVKNGWALNNAGIEVMHGIGGMGLATNYLAWNNTVEASTGTGKMTNLGFVYENTLSNVLGKEPGSMLPEVTFSAFGLLANASLDLPATNAALPVGSISQTKINQFKFGTDATVQPLNWLGVMLRFDQVNYDMDHPGYIFSAITGRLIFSSHYLSTESIYLQYSRYRYGDRMLLAGTWPWGQPLVDGSHIFQSGSYGGMKPDMDVFKIQANVSF